MEQYTHAIPSELWAANATLHGSGVITAQMAGDLKPDGSHVSDDRALMEGFVLR